MMLAFYKGEGRFFDRLIRWWTRGPYSHVEIVLDFDVTSQVGLCLSASPRDGHVREKLIDFKSGNWKLVSAPLFSKPRTHAIAKTTIGMGYDWLGIVFSQVLPMARQHRQKWFCSELCAAALGLTEPHRYSPNSLFNLCIDLYGISGAHNARDQ